MELFYDKNLRYPNHSGLECGWDMGSVVNLSNPFIAELESDGEFSHTPREFYYTDNGSCHGYLPYLYRKTAAGNVCNNNSSFGVLAVLFEEPHASLGLPNDEMDSCACQFGIGGDTCFNSGYPGSHRYGIQFND